jgi:hypothetical protein
MATYATVQDVADRLRRPISDQAERTAVERWLEDAESKIRGRIRDLTQLVTDADPAPLGLIQRRTVVSVEARAVARVAKNPEGYRSTTIDDYTRTRDRVLSDGEVRITDEEWAELIPTLTGAGLAGGYTIGFGTPL